MAIRVGGRAHGLPLLLLPGPMALVLAVAVLSFGAPVAAAASEAPAPSPGLVFHVGGPRGWRVPDAGTNYGWWAMNNRFHVGDELYFKYGSDSVLVVDRVAFDACNTTDPVAVFTDGATAFRLDRPGFFCFISGEPGHCDDGQRLVVRVMVHPPAPAPAPGPAEGPATSAQQPGHGGGGSAGAGAGGRPGEHGASCGGAAATAVGVALAAVAVVVASLVLVMFQ